MKGNTTNVRSNTNVQPVVSSKRPSGLELVRGTGIMRLPQEIRQLVDSDPYVGLILDAYAKLDRIYRESLEAMGYTKQFSVGVNNSADVTISFHDLASTTEQMA